MLRIDGTDLALSKRMIKVIGTIIYILCFLGTAQAAPGGEVYYEFNVPDVALLDGNDIELLDSQINRDLMQLSEERARFNELQSNAFIAGPTRILYDDSRIIRRILDRSVSRILKSPLFTKSKVGRAAETVSKNLKTDAAFVDEKNIQHKFKFKLQAFRSLAYIQYSGVADARFIYDYSVDRMTLSLDHKLGPSSVISINTALDRGRPHQYVSLQHTW